MGRVEAVIFAAAEPVTRETLARVVGKSCNLDLIIDDIRDELRGRPYELVVGRRRLAAPDPAGLCRRHPRGVWRSGDSSVDLCRSRRRWC